MLQTETIKKKKGISFGVMVLLAVKVDNSNTVVNIGCTLQIGNACRIARRACCKPEARLATELHFLQETCQISPHTTTASVIGETGEHQYETCRSLHMALKVICKL